MNGSKIGGTVSNTVTLGTGNYLSPLSVLSHGVVTVGTAGDGIFGPNSQAWVVVSEGRVQISATSGDGIELDDGGSVENSGTITAPGNGVYITGAVGAVFDSGVIMATAADAIDLQEGGEFTITSKGAVSTTAGTFFAAVYIGGAGGSVVDRGLIASNGRDGIDLAKGGWVSIGATGTINSTYTDTGYGAGVYIGGAAGTVVNQGKISATGDRNLDGIALVDGGSVDNTGTITAATGVFVDHAAGKVVNSGRIVVDSDGSFGIDLYAGGSFTNTARGHVQGAGGAGVYITGGAGTVVNAGRILSAEKNGVVLYEGGLLVNHRLIESHTDYSAVYCGGEHAAAGGMTIDNSGTIMNAGNYDGIFLTKVEGAYLLNSRGLISGGLAGISIGYYEGFFPSSVATIVNSGKIEGNAAFGVGLAAGGTIIDSGTIAGNGVAIRFGGTVSNLLELEAGFKISGSIVGSTYVGATNTLELSGPKRGVLTFNDTSFQNFDTIKVDADATWTLSGEASGLNFVNDGTVIADKKHTFTFGAVSEDASAHGTIELAKGGGAEFTSSVDANQTLVFRDATAHLVLDAPSIFTATIEDFRKGDALVLNKIAATNVVFSSGTLTISDSSTTVAALSLQGHHTTNEFVVTSLGTNGSEITIGIPKGKPLVFTQADPSSSESGGWSPGFHRTFADGAHPAYLGASEQWSKSFPPPVLGAAASAGIADAGSPLPWTNDPFHFWTIQG